MSWQERIELNPEILAGKLIIKGSRIAVEFVIDLLASGWREPDVLLNYPGLTTEDIRACLAYAVSRLRAENVYPLKG